jgi:hypothetical protein
VLVLVRRDRRTAPFDREAQASALVDERRKTAGSDEALDLLHDVGVKRDRLLRLTHAAILLE